MVWKHENLRVIDKTSASHLRLEKRKALSANFYIIQNIQIFRPKKTEGAPCGLERFSLKKSSKNNLGKNFQKVFPKKSHKNVLFWKNCKICSPNSPTQKVGSIPKNSKEGTLYARKNNPVKALQKPGPKTSIPTTVSYFAHKRFKKLNILKQASLLGSGIFLLFISRIDRKIMEICENY